VFAKIVKKIIENDGVHSLEAFAGSSLLALKGRWRKRGRRRCGGDCNGGHVEKSNGRDGRNVVSGRLKVLNEETFSVQS